MTIYCFSGTGNTRRVAAWMAEEAARQQVDASVRPINTTSDVSAPGQSADLVGIGMPTHGFTLPWAVLKFLIKLPRGNGRKAFAFATRAGARYGPIPGYPPGIAGSSIFIAALVLALKGYRVRGIMSVNMPSNWMSLHTGLRGDIVRTIIEKAKPRAEAFMRKILAGETVFFTGNVLWELVWGIALSWISAGYLFIGRFFLAKIFFATTECTGCGLCAAHCPTGSLTMRGKKHPRPYWSLTCESCMRCMGYCPEKAIESGHSWAAILYFVTGEIPVAALILKQIIEKAPWITRFSAPVEFLLFFAYYITVLWAGSLVFSLLLRIPLVNYLFTYTTLTHWYRRYHEPGIRLNDLK
ncbi:MAG TPA: EFR1 family ferrodoxin [Spirochaetota bacterium]|nr:EFR1 family ferrodoxin [Spirochaetota bacterium]HPI88861.1 EFR1 family ferrodoxin [Spirochaetota bacterium]HPR47009.1 EFR1 family ferrodoxin [Spirochaetota bacterium]